MVSNSLLRLNILLRSNVILGLCFFIKKKFSKKEILITSLPTKMQDVFNLNINHSRFKSFIEENSLKKEFIDDANNFVKGKIKIYDKVVSLVDYSIDKFDQNRNKSEVHNQDIRFHWEIYRGRNLFNIAVTYDITKDEKYALSLVEYIKNWEKYSPCIDDKVICNGMETALKLINLSFLDPLLKDSIHYSKNVQDELFKALIFHAEYTFKNYEITFYGLESNHGLSCAVGLIYAALLFPTYPNSKKWKKLGYAALHRALKKQFTSDGVNFESSVNYHRFIFELLIFLLGALYKQNQKVDFFVEESIRKIGNSLIRLTHANNMISRFGDSDGGKFLPDLNTMADFNNLQYLNWFTSLRDNEFFETLIFSNISQFNGFLNRNNFIGRVGNYISFRKKNLSLIITMNEIGTLGKGNHQHNDFLAFELYGKHPFIVDPWSHCYTGNPKSRNLDRKGNRHSTIVIDSNEMVQFSDSKLFEMIGDIKTTFHKLKEDEKSWSVVISHNGYKNLPQGEQTHKRSFHFFKNEMTLKVIDQIEGTGDHKAQINFLIPKKYWKLEQKHKKIIFSNTAERFIIEINDGKFIVNEDHISEWFSQQEEAYHLSFEVGYESNIEIITTIQYQTFKE